MTNNSQDHHTRVAQHFDQGATDWDNRYEVVTDIVTYELARRRDLSAQLLSQYIQTQNAHVMEIGCGSARGLVAVLADHPGWQGIGLDISSEMVALCHTKYGPESGMTFAEHNIEDGPLPGIDETLDAVMALGVIGYLKAPQAAFAYVAHMLKPGGILIATINKPSLPLALTRLYSWQGEMRQGIRRQRLNQSFTMRQIQGWLSPQFEIIDRRDYSYLPRVPVVNKWLRVNSAFENALGKTSSPLSRTTLFVARKRV